MDGATNSPRFDGTFRYDLDADHGSKTITFSKSPLDLALITADGQSLRLIGVHPKSKAPHSACGTAYLTRLAIENRRKQPAQCLWLRQRVEAHPAAEKTLTGRFR